MEYQQAAEWIKNADALLIGAGAGMGVDSGLPDFRGNQGFWNAYPPYAEKGFSFAEMANPGWFDEDPEFAWGFYGHRLNLYRQTMPHPGFQILLKWGEKMPHGYFVFTSNVDGHFQKAGFDQERILEVHGSIHHLQCIKNCGQSIFTSDSVQIDINEAAMLARQPLPQCPACQSLARPNILMFGDWGWDSSREDKQEANYKNWLSGLDGKKLVIVECGAGTAVPTVRFQSEQIANHFGGKVIRVNVRERHIYSPHIGIAAGAEETLRRLEVIRANS